MGTDLAALGFTAQELAAALNPGGDERADWSAAWALFPGHIAYVWHGALRSIPVAESLVQEGFTIRAQIIWAKERLVIGRGDWQHEPCW